jgi:hypothetical protein
MTSTDDTAQVVFDLLNPGDSINFDVLTDGRPGKFSTSFRMRGKYQLIEIPATQRTSQALVTFPQLPGGLQFSILILASVAVGAIFIGGVAGFSIVGTGVVRSLLGLPSISQQTLLRGVLLRVDLNRLLDDLPKPPDPTQAESSEAAAAARRFKTQLAGRLWGELPNPVDDMVRTQVERLDPSLSPQDIISRVRGMLSEDGLLRVFRERPLRDRIESDSLIGVGISLMFIITGVALIFVMNGTWHNYLA